MKRILHFHSLPFTIDSMSPEEIIKLLDSPTAAAKELVKKAYDFAFAVHKGQLRKSGEDYFTHVYGTAKILAELKMSAETVVAGLLHDSIEDGVAKEAEIKKEFGDEILFLVNGVTKLGKVKYQEGAERHIESLRKFLVATAQDIRVLIIKLADRLHNMRTLEYVPEAKQKRIALETLEIYAPLAYRLSIRKLSRELEDLAFKFLQPKEFEKTVEILKSTQKEALPDLEKFIRSLKKSLAENSIINFSTDYRQKGIYSFYKKWRDHKEDISQIYDILAARVCVPDIVDCYKVLGIIHANWRPLPGRIKDYIASPKPNGYKSLHTTVFTGEGSIVEVQIRTFEMNSIAEYGIASHLSYKEKGSEIKAKDDWFQQFLPKVANYSEVKNSKETPHWIHEIVDSQKNIKSDLEKRQFIEDLKVDFFNQRIFVLTPKGDVVDLPLGATTLDFAYAIHSDIGEHTSGAKVNNKMVSLDTKIMNGDIVEILTRDSSKPSAKWLEIVKTNMAKRHIGNYLEKTKRKTRK